MPLLPIPIHMRYSQCNPESRGSKSCTLYVYHPPQPLPMTCMRYKMLAPITWKNVATGHNLVAITFPAEYTWQKNLQYIKIILIKPILKVTHVALWLRQLWTAISSVQIQLGTFATSLSPSFLVISLLSVIKAQRCPKIFPKSFLKRSHICSFMTQN